MATFFQDALPVSIHGAVGSTVNLDTVLKQAFGENAASIASVQISYYDRSWLDQGNGTQPWQFWDPANEVTTKVLNLTNGQHTSTIHIDPTSKTEVFDFETFNANDFQNVGIKIGTNILPNVIIRVDQGDGVFRDLSISTLPDGLSPIFTTRPANHAPTAQQIVDTAHIFDAFSDKKGGIANAIDCHMIARDVAAAAGAPLDTLSYDAPHPENNEEGGFWRIAYRGSNPGAVHDWQSLVRPGDIVRMQVDSTGNFHTLTVTGALNAKGEIQVLDNQAGLISEHWADYDTDSRTGSVTIYRLTTDNMYLIDQSKDTHNTTIMGDNFNDQIMGGSGNNTLLGGKGADQLFGGAGNDTLDGGTGADEMMGGSGDDVYIVDNAKDVVNEIRLRGFGGIDRVETTLAEYSLVRSAQVMGSVENLTFTGIGDFTGTGNELENEIIGGAGNDHLFGNGGNDTLRGGIGNDTLDGGAGADQMYGGKGDDTYVVDNADDMVNELSFQKLTPTSHLPTLTDSGGIDTVKTSLASYSLNTAENSHIKGKIENLTYTGTGDFTGTGNGLDNKIIGSSGNDHLFGKDGVDTLLGSAGHDTLDGGTGADTMRGGSGNDIYIVDNAGDVVDESQHLGVHFIRDAGGIDEVQTTLSDYSLAPSNIAVHSPDFRGVIENLTFIGSGKFEGHGNGVANVITGGDSDDKLFGNAGDDTLIGGGGNDKLYGGSDKDVLIGGTGADTLTGDLTGGPNAADRFVFALGDNGVTAKTADHITDFGKGDTLDVSDFVASHDTIERTKNFHGSISEALSFANSELAKHHENGSAVLADSSSHNVYVFLDQDGDHKFESAIVLDHADSVMGDIHKEIASHQLFV